MTDPRQGRSRGEGVGMKTGLVPLIVVIAMGVLALYGLVTANSPWIRYGSISLILLAVAVGVFRWVKRRPKKRSLGGALRSPGESRAP